MDENTEYYVQELGVGTDYYDEIIVNDVKIGGVEVTAEDGVYPSSVATVAARAKVSYTNHCSDKNLSELQITKAIAEGSIYDGATFEFRVLLENAAGSLVPYSTGEYMIRNADGDYFRYENGQLTNNGKTPVTASKSGQNGTIAGIPAGYTVVISSLLSGTDFFVEEIRNPSGWVLDSKTVAEDSCDASDVQGRAFDGSTVTADGQIRHGSDAQVTFTNRAEAVIIARKVWESGNYVTKHGDIQTALFEKHEDGTLSFAEGTLRTISAPETTVEYKVGSVSDFVVCEVTVEDGKPVPVKAGDKITVSGEMTQIRENASDSYFVSYTKGEVRTEDGQGNAIAPVREDVITNTMPVMTVNKTDANSKQLAGAVFRLLQEDQKTAVPGYESFMSDSEADGNLLKDLRLSHGTYYLEEVAAPAGFNKLPHMIRIRVSAAGTDIKDDTDYAPASYDDQTPDDKLVYTVRIINNPGVELPATGGIGTGIFRLTGALLAALACVLLIARKRAYADGE